MDLIETGRIINTHGLRGEVKIEPWADSAEEFCGFRRLFIDGAEHAVQQARVQKRFVIAKLSGIDSIEEAEAVKNRTVYVDRSDIRLDEDGYLLADLIGCEAVDDRDGSVLGRVTGILTPPGGDVLEIHGDREVLVPLREEFVAGVDIQGRRVYLDLIEGM